MTEMVPRTIEDKEHVSCKHVSSHGKVPSAYATPYLSAHAPPSLSAEALQFAHWLVTTSMGFSRYHNQSKVSEGSLPCGANPQPDMESSPPTQLYKSGTCPFSKPDAVCEAAWLTPTCRTHGSQPPLYSSSLPSCGLPCPTKSSIPVTPTPVPRSHNAGPAYPSPTSTNKVNAMT